MSSSRLVRGAKTRMFAFVCLISVLAAVLYVFHGTQARLSEVQNQASLCNQKKESFNAQLQVIFEYKERLEKSLTREKDDRKQDKETHEREMVEAKEKWEKETTELNNKYEALVQKSKILQAQLEDQKESSDKALNKLQGDYNTLDATLAETKKKLELAEAKAIEGSSSLKEKYIAQKEELKACRQEVEDYKMKSAPAAEQQDYLTKQNEQLKAEWERAKHELGECKDKLTVSPKTSSANPRMQDAPESNVVDVPKLIGMQTHQSSTPGINPDAVGESSSLKPSKDLPEKREDEQVGMPPKKPTQESVIPLAQPKKFDDNPPPAGQAQIPGPPDSNPDMKPVAEDNNDLNNINLEEADDPQQQLEAKAQLVQPQFVNPLAVDQNRAEEEEEQQPMPNFKAPMPPV